VAEVRDVALAALALPVARYEPVLGDGVVSDDWTLACGDLPRDRWALAEFRGPVVLRAVNAASNTLSFGVAPRQVTALVGFSPGGRWLAIRHREELGIWDTSSDTTQRLAFVARPWTRGRSFNFTKVAFAPDDRAALWVDGGSVVATSLPDGAELARWPGAVESVAFDPSGKFFALARANEAAVELRSWPAGALVRVFSGNFPQPLCALALTAGAERIAGGDRAGRVTSWRGDGREGSIIELRGHAEMIRGMNFSKDGRLIAATSEEGTLRVWESSGGDELASLNFDAATLSFSSDGTHVGVGYGGGQLVQVRMERSPVLHTFRPDPAPETPQAVSFLPDGKALICLGLSQAFSCSVPDGRILAEHPFPRPYTVLAESAEGGGLLVSGAEGVWRYPIGGGGARAALLPGARWGWDSLTLSGNGRWIAASDNGGGRVAVWPSGSADPSQVKFVSMGRLGPGTIALSPDGTRLAVGYRYDPGLLIMDVASGESKQRLDLPARHAVSWSPDGRWLAACGTTAPMWDTTSWRPVALPGLEANHPPAGDVTFSPPEGGVCRWMAVVAGGSRVVLIDLARLQTAAVFEAPARRSIYRLAFSPDRRWLAAACARGEIQLWDLNAAKNRITSEEVAGR
jgi:WD40 repeat protein